MAAWSEAYAAGILMTYVSGTSLWMARRSLAACEIIFGLLLPPSIGKKT
jgi:hypothetical protein